MLTGAGGNIGLSVGEDGVVVVDDQFAPLAPKIKAAIQGITDKPVRFVLNTHWHFDHTGGNLDLAKAGAILVAHDNVRKRLVEGNPNLLGNKIDPAPKEALPVITFGQSLTVHLNGEEVRALHYPKGHTDGDSVIYFAKSNVVHMGDDFVRYASRCGATYVEQTDGVTASSWVFDASGKQIGAFYEDESTCSEWGSTCGPTGPGTGRGADPSDAAALRARVAAAPRLPVLSLQRSRRSYRYDGAVRWRKAATG
jgi:glyoxylase-like metal-dependent hydrolase (beta-lactamase superfamily II)